MLSAPAVIPAMIELNFSAGYNPADATRGGSDVNVTRSATSSDSPACSASAITGTRPAHDTRFSSSNNGGRRPRVRSVHFHRLLVPSDQDLDTPDSPTSQGISTSAPAASAPITAAGPRIQAKGASAAQGLRQPAPA
jgi:hypothetical protein